MIQVQTPFQQFFDLDGDPLDNGSIYIGAIGQNPETNLVQVYWDEAKTIPAVQPIKTSNGYIVRSGTPARVYVDGASYSMTVRQSNRQLVYTVPDATTFANSADIDFIAAGTGAELRDVQSKLRDVVSVFDFMDEAEIAAVQAGTSTDNTTSLQNALNTGKSLYFPQGVYVTDPLLVPFSARGAYYIGAGFYHYSATQQTVIKARTAGQSHIFRIGNSGTSGADCLTFQQMRIDCDGKSAIGIDATFGAFFTLTDAGVYNYTSFGVYHKQGLARYDRVFMSTAVAGAVGLHLYSDSTVSDSEFSGGAIPLKIVAGGNRIVNVWANSGSASCITLTPFDATTTHINTSMINVYAGEVLMSSPAGVRPIIEMVGSAAQKVQEVQFSNSYLVTAAGDDYKKNGGIYMDYCDAISISNIVIRGNGLGASADLYCDYFVKAQRSKTIAITGCTIKDVNHNPIYLVSAIDQPVVVSGCTFYNWGVGGVVTGAEAAAIRCETGMQVDVTGCVFHVDTGSAVPYAVSCDDSANVTFTSNTIGYANATIINAATGTPAGIWTRSGTKRISNHSITDSVFNNTNVNNSKQNFLARGQVSSSGGSTTTLTTLANVAENQYYIIAVKQSGAAANTVMGYASCNAGVLDVMRVVQSNTPGGAFDMNLSASGLSIQLTVGAGFGVTTWDWSITRLG